MCIFVAVATIFAFCRPRWILPVDALEVHEGHQVHVEETEAKLAASVCTRRTHNLKVVTTLKQRYQVKNVHKLEVNCGYLVVWAAARPNTRQACHGVKRNGVLVVIVAQASQCFTQFVGTGFSGQLMVQMFQKRQKSQERHVKMMLTLRVFCVSILFLHVFYPVLTMNKNKSVVFQVEIDPHAMHQVQLATPLEDGVGSGG